MENIFSLRVINKLIVDEKDLNTSKDKVKYLEDCFRDINESMINYFNRDTDQYLFHRAFYIDDIQGFVSIKLPAVSPMDPYITSQIHAIENHIKDNTVPTSFTELLNTQKRNGLCLYHHKEWDNQLPELDNVLCFDLDKDSTSRVENFFNAHPGTLEELTGQYTMISKEFHPTSAIYIYFIRPFTDQPHYNGTFNLILKRPLTEGEFLELGYVWTKILSDTAIVEGKEEEQKRIFQEHTHTWSTKLRALNQTMDEVHEHVGLLPPNEYTEHISEGMQLADKDIAELRSMIDFNLMMMKVGALSELIAQRKEFPSLLTVTDLNLNEILAGCVNTQKRYLKFWDETKSLEKQKLLESLANRLLKDRPVFIRGLKIPLVIIFNDLLKNAIVHTGHDPVIDVRVVRLSGSSVTVEFSNNVRLEEDVYHFINNDKYDSKIFLPRRFGIRTIKRIVNSQILRLNNLQATLYADEVSLQGETVIRLTLNYT